MNPVNQQESPCAAITQLGTSIVEDMRSCARSILDHPKPSSADDPDSDQLEAAHDFAANLLRVLAALAETIERARKSIFEIPTATLADQARRVLDLRNVAAESKESKKTADATLAAAETALIERMVEEEVSSTKLSDGTNLYLSRKGYCSKASGVETDELVEALRATKVPGSDRTFGDFVRDAVNYSGLRGTVSELAKQYEQEHPGSTMADALPETLRGMLRVYEEQTLNVRAGKKSA